MEKGSRQVIKSFRIILYIVLIISVSYVIVVNCLDVLDLKKTNSSLRDEFNPLNKEYKELTSSNSDIANKVDEIKNIDQLIFDEKELTFSLASNLEKKIKDGNNKYKIAYITFDDGPYYLTNRLLELLRQKQVKVTFFTIGSGKNSCIDNRSFDCTTMYEKEAKDNHTMANHTYSHAIFRGLYSSSDEFINQIQKQEDLILEKTGVKTNIVRFPGGSSTAGSKKNDIVSKLREKGYGWVDWTAQDGDGGDLTSKEQAWNTFKNSIDQDIEVILFHDYDEITYSILSDVIDYLEDNNYILLPLFYDSVMVNK